MPKMAFHLQGMREFMDGISTKGSIDKQGAAKLLKAVEDAHNKRAKANRELGQAMRAAAELRVAGAESPDQIGAAISKYIQDVNCW